MRERGSRAARQNGMLRPVEQYLPWMILGSLRRGSIFGKSFPDHDFPRALRDVRFHGGLLSPSRK